MPTGRRWASSRRGEVRAPVHAGPFLFVPLQFPFSPMMAFAIRIEHALYVAVQRSHRRRCNTVPRTGKRSTVSRSVLHTKVDENFGPSFGPVLEYGRASPGP